MWIVLTRGFGASEQVEGSVQGLGFQGSVNLRQEDGATAAHWTRGIFLGGPWVDPVRVAAHFTGRVVEQSGVVIADRLVGVTQHHPERITPFLVSFS